MQATVCVHLAGGSVKYNEFRFIIHVRLIEH